MNILLALYNLNMGYFQINTFNASVVSISINIHVEKLKSILQNSIFGIL